MYSIYVCDTETTGLSETKNDIIEVCFWRLGEEESKTWWMKPLNPENIEDAALKVNKHKREDILGLTKEGREKYRDPKEVLVEIEEWLMQDGSSAEERIIIGQNIDFDHRFMVQCWLKNGCRDSFPFGYWRNETDNITHKIDTMELVMFVDVLLGRKRKFYNLGSLVKDFDIKKAQAHRADGDVQMTKDLFEKIANAFKGPASVFADNYK